MGAVLCHDPAHAELLARGGQMAARIEALTLQLGLLRQQAREREERHAAETAGLRAKIEELEGRLKQDASNSSRPPSSDPPWKSRPPRWRPSGKRPGGQPGHAGTTRPLVPPERVDTSHDVRPPK